MFIKLISSTEQLLSLREDWNLLAAGHPLRSWQWAISWAQTMLGDDKLQVLVGYDSDERAVGIAPFYFQRTWTQGNIFRLIGDERCCTDYSGILADPNFEDVFIESIASWLATGKLPANTNSHPTGQAITFYDDEKPIVPEWDLIRLEATRAGDHAIQKLCQELEKRNGRAITQHNYSSWQIQFEGCWDSYVNQLSKSQRRNVRRVEKRVLNHPDFSVHIADDSASFKKGMQWFRSLHQKHWELAGKTGCFSFPDFANFLETAASRMYSNDSLRIMWIENAGQPVAVDFSLLSDSTSFGYQMGVDPDYRKLEVGRALQVLIMKSTLESGRANFDFLRGDEAYKSRWNAKETKLLEIEIAPERLLAQIQQNLTHLGRSLKNAWLDWPNPNWQTGIIQTATICPRKGCRTRRCRH